MTDNQTAQATVGSIYNYVLIASERIREINRERAASDIYTKEISEYAKLEKPHLKAAREIAEGKVGIEYMKKINRRIRANRDNRDNRGIR